MSRFLIIIFLGISFLNSCKNKEEEVFGENYDYSFFEESLLEKEFESLATSLISEEISTQDYLNWTYDFQTKNENGPSLTEEFESVIFTRANEDERYLEKISIFFSEWDDAAELLQKHEHPGAAKIAKTILANVN